MSKVICFGEILWDTFEDGKKAGGAPLNVAMHLKQQGAEVAFASRIGNDTAGDELLEFLVINDLLSELMQRDEFLPTCEVTVELDKEQHATYIIPKPVSWDNIQTDSLLTRSAKQASAIVFGSLACRSKITRDTLLNLLGETRALKIFDVNLRAPHYDLDTVETLVARSDMVKMNEDEAKLLIGGSSNDLREQIIEFRSKYHTKTICVTRGENGAIVWHDHEFYESAGLPVEVSDTVGAGDSFLATFIAGLLTGVNMQKLLDRACAVGAFVASKRGANPAYDEHIRRLLGSVTVDN